jgi:hypothetical protein
MNRQADLTEFRYGKTFARQQCRQSPALSAIQVDAESFFKTESLAA